MARPVVALMGSYTWRSRVLALALDAIRVSILFARELGPVPDQETGIAGELVLGLGNDLNDQFLGDKLTARGHCIIQRIGLVQLTDHAAGIWCVSGLQGLQRTVLRFLDVGTDFVVIGCHFGD